MKISFSCACGAASLAPPSQTAAALELLSVAGLGFTQRLRAPCRAYPSYAYPTGGLIRQAMITTSGSAPPVEPVHRKQYPSAAPRPVWIIHRRLLIQAPAPRLLLPNRIGPTATAPRTLPRLSSLSDAWQRVVNHQYTQSIPVGGDSAKACGGHT